MVWNHRVVRRVYTHESGEEEVTFSVHEAYYPAIGVEADSITMESVTPVGETLDELREELTRMLKATEHPVLDYSKF